MATTKVKFTRAYSTKSATDPESFEEGEVVDFAELRGDEEAGRQSAQHFVNRGVAVPYDEDAERQERRAGRRAAAAEKDYESQTVEELHQEAARRNIEGRSALTTKADLVKALEKSDKATTPAQPPQQPKK